MGLVALAGLMLGGSYGDQWAHDSVRYLPDGEDIHGQGGEGSGSRDTRGNAFAITVHSLAGDGITEPERPIVTPVVEATPEPVVTATSVPWSIEGIICSYSWPCDVAVAVAKCEAYDWLDVNAYNPESGASGLYQLIPYWHSWRLGPGESFFDPAVNVRIAHDLWLESGWSPWYASRHCWGG